MTTEDDLAVIEKHYSCTNNGSLTEEHDACPVWMATYAAFHNANKFSPTAKYLIYHCAAGKREVCNGLGDRLHGIMFMTRIAAGTHRVLIINSTQPVAFEHAFVPVMFDWRVGNISSPCEDPHIPCTAIDKAGRQVSSMYWTSNGGWGTPEWIQNGTLLSGAAAATTHIYMTACTIPSSSLDSWAPAFHPLSEESTDSHCLFSLLFQPSALIRDKVKAFQKQLGINNDVKRAGYVAIHVRLGVDGSSEEQALHIHINGSFACAKKLAQVYNLTVIVVATDSDRLRKKIRNGVHPGVVSVDIHAAHIHHVKHDDNNALWKFADTVSEFVLLAQSRCFITSNSGYSNVALCMGGQSCQHKCQDYPSSGYCFNRLTSV